MFSKINIKNLFSAFIIFYFVLGIGGFWQKSVLAAEFVDPGQEELIIIDPEIQNQNLVQNTDQANISPNLRNKLTQQPHSEIELDPYSASCNGVWDFSSNLGFCLTRIAINITGYIIMLFAMLIGAVIDLGIFIVFWIIENILAQNPTNRDGIFWDLGVQVYAITSNIANLLILFSFYYVGFQYLFGFKNNRMGWQEFLAKVVAATILVNFSLFIVSIFVTLLHDIGQLFVNIFAQGGGTIGGAFQNAVKRAAGYYLDGKNVVDISTFPNIFIDPGKFYGIVVVRIVYVFITVFILINLIRLLKVAITRFVLLFLLLIVAPLGVVMLFSPIKALKEQGDVWIKTLWTQAILYPFFVISLSIGTVFIAGFAEAAGASDSGAFEENFTAQMPRIMALLVAYGVIKIIADWFEKSFEGIASDTWNGIKKGAFAAGGLLGTSASLGLGLGKGLLGGGLKGIREGYNKFSGGGTSFGARAKGVVGGALGGIGGATLGAVKESMNIGRHLDYARRGAFNIGGAVDMLGGQESVINEIMSKKGVVGRILKASGERSKSETSNVSSLVAKKAGSLIHEGLARLGYFRDIERLVSELTDVINPDSIYRGKYGSDLPNTRIGWQQIAAQGRMIFRRGIGLDTSLSSANVINTLNRIRNRIRNKEDLKNAYLNNFQEFNEVMEELLKRPELARRLDSRLIEMFQANYKQMAENPEWSKFVEEYAPFLADEDTLKKIAAANGNDGLAMIKEGRVRASNFDNPLYAETYLLHYKGNLEELSRMVGRDFASFEMESYKAANGEPPAEIAEAVRSIQTRGIPDRIRAEIYKAVQGSFPTDEALANATVADIENKIRQVAPNILNEKHFYNSNQHKQDIYGATTAADLRTLMEQNVETKSFLDKWEKINGPLTDDKIDAVRQQYQRVVDTTIAGYQANSSAIANEAENFIKGNSRLNIVKEQEAARIQREIAQNQRSQANTAGQGANTGTNVQPVIYGPQGQVLSRQPQPQIQQPQPQIQPTITEFVADTGSVAKQIEQAIKGIQFKASESDLSDKLKDLNERITDLARKIGQLSSSGGSIDPSHLPKLQQLQAELNRQVQNRINSGEIDSGQIQNIDSELGGLQTWYRNNNPPTNP